MMRSLMAVLILLGSASILMAQVGESDIGRLVSQVNDGEDEAAREQLPSLVSKYPNNPGVLYLQALLTREGADAVRTYQSIVDNFPKSEWADDALFKVYQFYYALGLYRTAELKLDQLKTHYPASPYDAAATGNASGGSRPDSAAVTPVQQPLPEAGSQIGAPSDPPPAQMKSETPAEQTPAEHAPASTEPAVEPVPAQPETAIPVRFSLQVGAFTLQPNAEVQKAKLEALGYTTDMVSKVRDTRSLFIVLVGDYATYAEAKAAAAGVKKKMGIEAMVISR